LEGLLDQASNARVGALIGQIKALQRAMEHSVAERNQEFARYESFGIFARRYNSMAEQARPFLDGTVIVNVFDPEKLKNPSSLTWPMQKQYFDSVYAETLMLLAALEGQFDFAEAKTVELKSFFETSLRRAVFTPPENERELQDIVERLLIGRGFKKAVDYDRETGRVKYSGKEFVPDFVYIPADMFIEVKLIKSAERSKTAIEEINSDILAYKTRYSKGMFLVYDLGIIRDVSEFVGSIEQQMNISVCLVKH
jgi:hypothetical protein